MSYQVIARKWRPQAFAEVTGQEHITRTLRNAIEHERLHHAYLFSGARGVGKTTTARLLAKALNCHKSDKPTPTPCSFNDPAACPACVEIAEGRAIDVQEIDAASNTGVDNVREAIISSINIAPARDRYKVFVIDEVHMLSTSAFNALLKTLEEPPPRVAFIMATTEKHKLPDTILSRCQQFEFRAIATAKIAERLRLIADAEGVSVSDEALRAVARAGDGSMRDAQSAFDQVISFSTGAEISAETVETALGLASRELLRRTMQAVVTQNGAEILAVVDDLVMRGHDLRNFCRDVLAYLRDLLVVKISDAPDIVDASDDERAALNEQAEQFSESDLTRFFHSLAETEAELKTAPHPRYHLEVGLVKLAEMRRLAPLAGILERLERLEESLRNGGGSLPPAPIKPPPANNAPGAPSAPRSFNPPPAPPRSFAAAAPAPAPKTFTPPPPPPVSLSAPAVATPAPSVAVAPFSEVYLGALDSGTLFSGLKAGLEKRSKMILSIHLGAAHNLRAEDGKLVVEFTPANKTAQEQLSKPENKKLLREICLEQFGVELSPAVNLQEADGDSPIQRQQAAEDQAQKQREETVRNHPVVQQFLEAFGGDIVGLTSEK
jgi:DNA polymerase-3 subunit gamma/tau